MAAAVPGYVPTWTVPDGAAELAAAYTEHGLTEEAFRARFTRLAVLHDTPLALGPSGADMIATALLAMPEG